MKGRVNKNDTQVNVLLYIIIFTQVEVQVLMGAG